MSVDAKIAALQAAAQAQQAKMQASVYAGGITIPRNSQGTYTLPPYGYAGAYGVGAAGMGSSINKPKVVVPKVIDSEKLVRLANELKDLIGEYTTNREITVSNTEFGLALTRARNALIGLASDQWADAAKNKAGKEDE